MWDVAPVVADEGETGGRRLKEGLHFKPPMSKHGILTAGR